MAKQTLTYNTVTGNWELTETNQGKTYTNTLLTDNKNISGDIKINITAKTGTAGTPVAEKGAVSGNKVVITPKVTNTEGYIATGTITGTAIEVTAAELVSGTKTISASGVQDCKTYASVNVPAGSAKVNNSTIVPTISQSGNKITVSGSTTSSGTVTTAGWITSITNGTASIQNTTYTIPGGELANVGTTGVTYTENTDPGTVLPKNGALYINAGYYDNTKITLGHLIPDSTAPYEDPGSGDMRSGFVAFDSEGNEIIGTMAEVTPTFSGGVASLTGKTSSMTTTMATVNSSTYYVNVQGKAKATRTSVTYANNYTGYLDKASGTNASSSNTSSEDTVVNTTVYIKAGAVTNNTSGGTSSGTINRGKQIKIDSGYYGSTLYYQAQSNAGTKTITENGATTCDGYASVDIQVPTGITPTGTITLTQQTGTNVTNYASANVRGATYSASLTYTINSETKKATFTPSVKVTQSGWVESGVNGSAVEITPFDLCFGETIITQVPQNVTGYEVARVRGATYGATLSQALSGTKITITPSVSVSQSGWVESGKTGTSVVINATDFGTGVVTPTVDSLSSPTVVVSGSASGMVTATNGTYYVEVTGTKTDGSVKAKETRSAGYVSAGNSSSTATTITPNVTGSGSKVYIQAGALGAGVSGNITFTPSVATNMATITKPSSGTEGTDYFSITGSGTKSGSVSGTANVSTEGYVKTETASGGSATGSISADAKKYISKATITNNTSGGTSSGTINRGNQIKIAQGYNPSTVYYQAQANSGSTVIIQQSGQSVDGYASVSVQEATPSFSGGVASITNPTSTYTTNMIVDSTSTYYINVQASAKATRTAVNYNGAVSGWVEKANGTQASASNTSAETEVANSTISIKELVLTTATTSRSSTDYPTTARVETLARSTLTRYILIPEGYHPTKQYYQISSVANSSWTGPTTAIPTTPGTQKTVTAGSEDQYIVIPAGYAAARSVKINALTVYDGSYDS